MPCPRTRFPPQTTHALPEAGRVSRFLPPGRACSFRACLQSTRRAGSGWLLKRRSERCTSVRGLLLQARVRVERAVGAAGKPGHLRHVALALASCSSMQAAAACNDAYVTQRRVESKATQRCKVGLASQKRRAAAACTWAARVVRRRHALDIGILCGLVDRTAQALPRDAPLRLHLDRSLWLWALAVSAPPP